MYSDELDVNKPPEIWVMLRGWFGLTSTGNQTVVAFLQLFQLLKAQFPKAEDTVFKRMYVDDLVPGAHSIEEREDQIADTVNLLKNGGFEIKFVSKSGSPPPENASTVECIHSTESVLFKVLFDGLYRKNQDSPCFTYMEK